MAGRYAAWRGRYAAWRGRFAAWRGRFAAERGRYAAMAVMLGPIPQLHFLYSTCTAVQSISVYLVLCALLYRLYTLEYRKDPGAFR